MRTLFSSSRLLGSSSRAAASLRAWGAGKLLHERVGLLEAQLLPEGGRLDELGFGAEGHGAGGHLGHPLLHPAEGAVLEGGEHGLFFQPGVKDGVDDPVHDLFVPVQVGL